MLASFARTLIGMALALVGAAWWLSPQSMVPLVVAAGLALAGALLMRRVGSTPAEAVLASPEVEDDRPLGEAGCLLVFLDRASQCIAQAPSLPQALLGVRQVLETELGARSVRLFTVERGDGQRALLREIDSVSAALPGYRCPAIGQPLDGRPLAMAVATGTVAGGAAQGHAVPVLAHGATVAVMEIGATAVAVPEAEMKAALGVLSAQLGLLQTGAPASASASASLSASAVEPQPEPAAGPALAASDTGGADGPQGRSPEAPGFLNGIFEALPTAVFVLNCTELRLLALNRRAEQEFNLQREKLLGRTFRGAFLPSLCDVVEPVMRRAIDESQEVACDVDWLSPEGPRTVQLSNVVATLADGCRCLLVTASDVTAQRQAQRALQESQSVLHQFADTVEESLFVSNPERTVFHFLAGSLYDRWGVTREHMIDKPGAFLHHVLEEDRHLIDQRHAGEQTLKPVDVVFRIRHPVKGLRWLRSRTRSLAMPDGEIRVFGLVSDVTEDKVREEDIKRTRDAAEAASLAKSQFMANMSHEIRTPMNGILGMTELLLGTRLADKQRRFAQAVYRSGESLLEIINDILDFSKIEVGRLELAPADFSLRGLVEDTLELLAPRAHEKGLDLSFCEEEDLPLTVHGDALRLRQVLTNLVANAIKFTPSGEVVVDIRRLPPEQCDSPNDDRSCWLAFEVRDTGIGIDEEMLPRLFNAFTQGSGDMARRFGGTGLGLAISKQLVELMGGQMEVHSQPGQGSRFCFRLRLQTAQRADAVDLGTDDAVLSGCRVLVVEDHETNRTILNDMLAGWGMRVTLAVDGQHALDILRNAPAGESPFDLALVDMHMPRMDGLTLARTLQQYGSHPLMRMVMLSSVSSPDDARAAQLAGFQRFLPKPLRKAELRQALASLVAPLREREAQSGQAVLLSGQVLVVEDNPVNQEVIGQMLRGMGLRVQMAPGAMQGLRLLCEAHFDLVLMDIMMPGMDGIEAIGWFRRGSGGRFQFRTPSTTPVVAVTANALQGDEERFLGLGFDDYLSKPFRQNQLLCMLTKYLRPQPARPDDEPTTSAGALQPVAGPGSADGATSAAPPRGSAVLDASALGRLRELDPSGKNKLMERVVLAFQTSAGRLVPQAQQACLSHDLDSVRHVVHTLKSSSASMGALRLSKLCADLESMIRLDQVDNLQRRVNEVCDEVKVVLQALTELMKPQP